MVDVLLCQGTARALPLQDASVHCCVTSPPYYGLRDYGTGTWQGGDAECPHTKITSTNTAAVTLHSPSANTNHALEGWKGGVCGHCGATRVDQQLGLEASVEAYVEAMVQVFREVRRVLRPDGTLWLNCGDSYAGSSMTGGSGKGTLDGAPHASIKGQDMRFAGQRGTPGLPAKNLLGMPWRLAFALQDAGWILRADVIWDKPSCMPESVTDRPTRSHEYVFMFAKQAHYHYDAQAIREPGITGYSTRSTMLYSRAREADPHDARGRSMTGKQHADEPSYGRNARTVWHIPSEPFCGSHFATMPTALVRRCLLAGAPSQVCAACGAPWKRAVERLPNPMGINGGEHREVGRSGALGPRQRDLAREKQIGNVTTTGFAPTCACHAGTAPSVVLDPFAGSGTVGLVARALGHHAVLCDLSWPYLHAIARERLGLAALAAWEGRHGHATPAVRYDDLPLFGG